MGAVFVLMHVVFALLKNEFAQLASAPSFLMMVCVLSVLIFAPLAIAIGGWLTRFPPFTQSLIFGLGASVIVLFVAVAIDAVTTLNQTCHPADYCARFGEGIIWVIYLYLGPVFLLAVLSYGFAAWSSTPRRTKWVLVPALTLSVCFVVVMLVLMYLGALDYVSVEPQVPVIERFGESGDFCTMIGADGVEREIDCPVTADGERPGPNSIG